MGIVKTTVEIADALFHEAKACAEARGVSFRHVVEEGLSAVIDLQKHVRSKFILRDVSFGGAVPVADVPSWPEIRQSIYEGRGEP